MSVTKLSLTDFLQLAQTHLVLDVRSPGEYAHAHLPGAHSLPLFTDDERAVTGTAYKQQSRETAIKIGLDFFGPKMRPMVEETERLLAAMAKKQRGITLSESPKVLVHCWRGGMRSAGVAWLLDLYGFSVYTLEGGYKAYRNWVLQQFERPYHFQIIGGYTGSGKTPLVHALARAGHATVDLEALANHRGSALGGINQPPQPTQEMFENQLAMDLFTATASDPAMPIFLEDESQRIGNMQLPMPLWRTMQRSPVYFLDIPFEERLTYLTGEYGRLPKEKLVNAIIRIQKRLGGLETKTAIAHLVEDNYQESFRVLLWYYDKWYAKGLYGRDNADALIHKIDAERVDTSQNLELLTQNINPQC